MKLTAGVLIISLLGTGVALACGHPDPAPGSEEAVATGEGIVWASFSDATTRYAHGVYGEKIESAGLRVRTADKGPCELFVLLGENSVFEDRTPRIADIDGDGKNDVVVIETLAGKGAAIAVYSVVEGRLKKIAATPNIGLSNRWLAPVGIADFNADGLADIAYVETPHIGGTLRIWTMRRSGRLKEIAQVGGLSNHKIGEDLISGGVRICPGERPMMITADNGWQRLIGVELKTSGTVITELGPFEGPESFERALTC